MQRAIWLLIVASGCRFDERGLPIEAADAAAIADAEREAPDAARDADASPDARPARPDAGIATCPTDYERLGGVGTLYRLAANEARWGDAELDCENDGAGTHLVVLDSAAELALVARLIGDSEAWIGVTNRVASDEWRTVLGALAAVLPWRDDAPFGGLERCVLLEGEDGEIGDESCNQRELYVCECDGIEPDPDAF